MMTSIKNTTIGLLFISICLNFWSCSGSSNSSEGDNSQKYTREEIASNNLNKMNEQIDKALANGDFAFAFDVLNTIPSHFLGSSSMFWYNPTTGDIGEYGKGRDEKYTSDQYVRKAISVLKAESDVLLSKDNMEAENLFLEHLANFELGVNTVNLGTFVKWSSESKANEAYQNAVTIYNDYLISVIRLAMVKNKSELAKKIALLIRDGLSYNNVDSAKYTWAYDSEAKDEAKEIIDSHSAN